MIVFISDWFIKKKFALRCFFPLFFFFYSFSGWCRYLHDAQRSALFLSLSLSLSLHALKMCVRVCVCVLLSECLCFFAF